MKIKSKIKSAIIYALSAICFGASGFSAATVYAAGETLKVGYIPNTNFIEEDRPGHYRGYGYEYMEFLAKYGNWNFEYVPIFSWKECCEKLNSGEIDILPAMPGYYKTVPNSTRTDHVVGRFPMELVVGAGGVKPHMKIGMLPHNCPTPGFSHIAEGEGFTYEEVKFDLYYDMVEALKSGKIDGYVDAMLNPRQSQNAQSLFDRQSYRALVRADRKDLLDKLNLAMDQLLLYQPNIRDRLNQTYIRSDGFPLILNRDEREYLKEKEKITAVIFMWQKPLAWTEGGEIHGTLVDIAKRIAEDLKIEVEILPTNSPKEGAELLRLGKADFALDAVCDFSWASNHNISPTQPYINMSYVSVRRRGEKPDEYSKIAVCENFLYTQNHIEKRYPKERLVYFKTIEECFAAVSEGKADLAFAPRAEVNAILEEIDIYNLEAASESFFSDSLSLGVRKDVDDKLWMILNKEINHLDSDWIRNLLNATDGTSRAMTAKSFIYHYPLQAFGILTLIAAALMGAFWYRESMKKKHLAEIQHIAYTDFRYALPNLSWLEKEAAAVVEKYEDKLNEELYVVLFAEENKSAVVEYGREVLVNHIKRIAAALERKDWVLLIATGVDSGQLVTICRAKNDTQIKKVVGEAVNKYSYIETPDSRIKLATNAGICALKGNLMQAVDRAGAAARDSEENVRFFDGALEEQIGLRQKIESSMEKALEKGEFHAWYQPKYDIKTRRIVGAEALVRWISPDMGFMPPGKFIPLFETNGFVLSVDYCLLEQAFSLQKQRLAEGKEVVPISVNQSRLHLTEDGYLNKMQALVDKYDLPNGLIELELTETVFGDLEQREQQKNATEIVNALHEMGFSISVDDFGSGYSSFTMLSFLPLDVMKIDRSLLIATDNSLRSRDILSNIIQLGKTLNMQIICEGIETKEQENLLLELGCHLGQGYLNAKPMPVDEFVAFMDERNKTAL